METDYNIKIPSYVNPWASVSRFFIPFYRLESQEDAKTHQINLFQI